MRQEMNIHLFQDMNHKYIFDVNRNAILQVSPDTFSILEQNSGINNESLNQEIEVLISQGYLSTNRPEEMLHSNNDFVEELLNNKVGRLCLQITQQCNFRCEYCVYSGAYENRIHTQKTMPWAIAKKSIDFLIEHSRDAEILDLSFYGGEPLLEYGMISQCIDYIRDQAVGKKITFNMTTNGSLLTDEMIEKFIDCGLTLSISLDGPQEVHDKNRKFVNGEGSFNVIYDKLKGFIRRYPQIKKNLQFTMVIDPTNKLDCINQFILEEKELFEESSLNASIISEEYRIEPLEYDKTFVNDWKYGQFQYMLYMLGRITDAEYNSKLFRGEFLKHMEFAKLTRTKLPLLSKVEHHSGPCVPGHLRLFVSADGIFYPCERVDEDSKIMQIGSVDQGFNFDKCKELLNVGKITEAECNECFAIRNCTLCAALADNKINLSKEKKLQACEAVKYDFSEMLKDLCVLKRCGFTVEQTTVERNS